MPGLFRPWSCHAGNASAHARSIRGCTWASLSTIVALILLELTSVDMDLANLFFDRAAGEFIGRHSYLLETILHDRVKQVVIA
jgi:membrane-associated PAP2 superfamily phosphatase